MPPSAQMLRFLREMRLIRALNLRTQKGSILSSSFTKVSQKAQKKLSKQKHCGTITRKRKQTCQFPDHWCFFSKLLRFAFSKEEIVPEPVLNYTAACFQQGTLLLFEKELLVLLQVSQKGKPLSFPTSEALTFSPCKTEWNHGMSEGNHCKSHKSKFSRQSLFHHWHCAPQALSDWLSESFSSLGLSLQRFQCLLCRLLTNCYSS